MKAGLPPDFVSLSTDDFLPDSFPPLKASQSSFVQQKKKQKSSVPPTGRVEGQNDEADTWALVIVQAG